MTGEAIGIADKACQAKNPIARYRRAHFAALAVLILTLAGCRTTITPPAHVRDPSTVYLHLQGRHSSVLFPTGRDLYVEYTFGEWNFFALRKTGRANMLGAAIGLGEPTLGRRYWRESGLMSSGRTLLPIIVSRRRVEALREELDARFGRKANTMIFNEVYGLYFVRDSRRYHIFSNCNHVTAEWLERLGCRVEGTRITRNFVILGQ